MKDEQIEFRVLSMLASDNKSTQAAARLYLSLNDVTPEILAREVLLRDKIVDRLELSKFILDLRTLGLIEALSPELIECYHRYHSERKWWERFLIVTAITETHCNETTATFFEYVLFNDISAPYLDNFMAELIIPQLTACLDTPQLVQTLFQYYRKHDGKIRELILKHIQDLGSDAAIFIPLLVKQLERLAKVYDHQAAIMVKQISVLCMTMTLVKLGGVNEALRILEIAKQAMQGANPQSEHVAGGIVYALKQVNHPEAIAAVQAWKNEYEN